MRRLLLLGGCLAASGAVACPSAPPAPGEVIRVEYASGDALLVALREDGLQISDFVEADFEDEIYREVGLHGLHVVEMVLVDEEGAVIDRPEFVVFGDAAETLPAPEPGLTWEGTAAGSDMGGDTVWPRRISLAIGAETEVDYGGCTYAAWPVERETETDYPEGRERLAERLDYLPDLGIAVLRRIEEEGFAPEVLDPETIVLEDR